MRITEERKRKILFTDKYYQTPAVFVAAKSAEFSIDEAGLAGKNNGVQQGTIHDRYTGQDEVYLDMQNGRLDLTFGNSGQLSLAFLDKKEGEDFEFKGKAVTDKAYIGKGTALALRKQDSKLAKQFNNAIEEIRANGTYDKIAVK